MTLFCQLVANVIVYGFVAEKSARTIPWEPSHYL